MTCRLCPVRFCSSHCTAEPFRRRWGSRDDTSGQQPPRASADRQYRCIPATATSGFRRAGFVPQEKTVHPAKQVRPDQVQPDPARSADAYYQAPQPEPGACF